MATWSVLPHFNCMLGKRLNLCKLPKIYSPMWFGNTCISMVIEISLAILK